MQTYRTIALVAGGELDAGLLPQIRRSDLIIGVDNGAWWLLSNQCIPGVAIGDFDSVTTSQFEEIKKQVAIVKHYSSHKNYTDTELAVRYTVKLKPQEIIIYGGIGSRIDHTLGVLGLLEYIASKKIHGVMEGTHYHIELLSVGIHKVSRVKKLPYISLIPTTASARISLEGFSYNGTHTLKRSHAKGISNELTNNSGTITIHRGSLLCIQTTD